MKLPAVLVTLTVLTVLTVIAATVSAETRHVYFGTGGRNAEGIYRATFDTETGKLSEATLAATIERPGFLAVHPDGDKLYAVATKDKEGGAAGYRIQDDGSLEMINFVPSGDGGGAHIAVHPSGAFLMTAQYGRRLLIRTGWGFHPMRTMPSFPTSAWTGS